MTPFDFAAALPVPLSPAHGWATLPPAHELVRQLADVYGNEPALVRVLAPDPADTRFSSLSEATSRASPAVDDLLPMFLAHTVSGGLLDPVTLGADVPWTLWIFQCLDQPELAWRVAVTWTRHLDRLRREDQEIDPVVAAVNLYSLGVCELARGRWARARRCVREATTWVEHEDMAGLDHAVVVRVKALLEWAECRTARLSFSPRQGPGTGPSQSAHET